MKKAFNITAKDMAELGQKECVKEFTPSCNLVYSSPGTLSYNSPGALGFGVKRAALVIPQSVMLLVAPDCCGRNSTILSESEGYASRMFYLRMTESDLITGGHLKLIPSAIKEICNTCKIMPRVVVVCVTCVDALLGTDVERVCRQAEAEVNSQDFQCSAVQKSATHPLARRKVRVVPSYMYALTREGTRPPMTAIRDTIYSLLERLPVKSDAVNLMGFFSSLSPHSELFKILDSMGIKRVRQVPQCKTLEEYAAMGEANFNIVLNGEAVYAAERLKERLEMPYVEIHRLYDTERIAKQYRLFAAAIDATLDDKLLKKCKEDADDAVKAFKATAARVLCHKKSGRSANNSHSLPPSFAIGQMINASPFELSASLCKMGFSVPYIIATPSGIDWQYIKVLASLSPKTNIYPPAHPSMALFERVESGADIAVGKDIAPLFPNAVSLSWNSEEEPYGFQAVKSFFDSINSLLSSMRDALAVSG